MVTAPPSSREKILEVSESLFARRGYAGVGMREVAEAAGLGKSSLFHHFRSKAQLYCEVQARVLARIRDRLASVQRDGGPAPTLERWIGAVIDELAEHPTSARLLLRGLFEEDEFLLDPPPEAATTEAILAGILGQVHALLSEGVAAGVFRPVSVPDTVQTLVGATVYHFASADVGETILGGPLFSAESVARRKREVIALLRHGLAVPDPQPSSKEDLS